MLDSAELKKTVRELLAEKTSKFDDGVKGRADAKYNGCIEALKALIAMGAAKTDEDKEIIRDAIAEFRSHQNLGTIANGEFKPISAAIAARYNILPGKYISGKKFLVYSRDSATKVLDDPVVADFDKDTIWDEDSRSVIHAASFYRRYPDRILGLHSRDIDRWGLRDLFLEQLWS